MESGNAAGPVPVFGEEEGVFLVDHKANAEQGRFPGCCWLVVLLWMLGAGCSDGYTGSPLPDGQFQYPVGLAVHPSGYLLVLSSNFDVGYKAGSLRVVDLNEVAKRVEAGQALGDKQAGLVDAAVVLPGQQVEVPNFGSLVQISADGKQAGLVVRETSELLLFDLATGAGGLTVNCWGTSGRPAEKWPVCSPNHRVQLVETESDTRAISQPFDLAFVDITTPAGEPARMVLVNYLIRREVDWACLSPQTMANCPQRVAESYVVFPSGGYNLTSSSATGWVAMSSRPAVDNFCPVHFLKPLSPGTDIPARSVNLFPLVRGYELRSVQYLEDGVTLVTALRAPDELIFWDVSLDADGYPAPTFLSSIRLPGRPTRVRSAGGYVFVTLMEEDTLAVFDARTRSLVNFREDICVGPFDIAFANPGAHKWAVVSCFADQQLAVLDVDPASPSFFKVVARVGRLPKE